MICRPSPQPIVITVPLLLGLSSRLEGFEAPIILNIRSTSNVYLHERARELGGMEGSADRKVDRVIVLPNSQGRHIES